MSKSLYCNVLLIIIFFFYDSGDDGRIVVQQLTVGFRIIMDGGSGVVNDTSNSTILVDEYDYSERPETYIVPVLFAFIFFVGTVGNGSLVLIFIRHRNMINVPNIYILSLALGDLLVLLSCIPFTSTVYTVRYKYQIFKLLSFNIIIL